MRTSEKTDGYSAARLKHRMGKAVTISQTAAKPFDQFRELTEGLFGVSKQEIDAKIAEEKAKRQAERERKRQERQQTQK